MRIFGYNLSLRREARDDKPTSPTDDRWYQPFLFGSPTSSGALVNPHSALTHPTVYSCVKVISETLSMLPLILYKRGTADDEKMRASDHPLYLLLKKTPNPRQTSLEFREMMTGHYLLRGNAYAQIIRSRDGKVHSLWPLHPGKMQVIANRNEATGEVEIIYKYALNDLKTILFASEEILHLKGPSDDGLVGRTPIDCFRDTIGLGMTMGTYQANFYANSASPSGILSLPAGKTLSPKAKDRLREDWKKKFSGTYQSNNIAVLEEGVTWQQIGMTSTDAEFVESEKMNDLKIARCFRMPPHKIGILDRATFSNIEHQGTEFYTDTMLPHLKRWEQVIDRDLLRGEKPDKYFAEFLVDAILRGDTITRYRSYAIGRQWGWLSANDIRKKENMNPIEGGDIYLQPLNMIEASLAEDYLMKEPEGDDETLPDVKNEIDDPSNPTFNSKNALKISLEKRLDILQKNSKKPIKIEEKQQDLTKKVIFSAEKAKNSLRGFSNLSRDIFTDFFSRMLTKESQAANVARRKDNFEEFEKKFYTEHSKFVKTHLRNLVLNYVEQVRFIASIENGSTIPEPSIDAAHKRVMDEIVEYYYNNFKEAKSDKILEYSVNIAEKLVQSIEDVCLWNLNKGETNGN